MAASFKAQQMLRTRQPRATNPQRTHQQQHPTNLNRRKRAPRQIDTVWLENLIHQRLRHLHNVSGQHQTNRRRQHTLPRRLIQKRTAHK